MISLDAMLSLAVYLCAVLLVAASVFFLSEKAAANFTYTTLAHEAEECAFIADTFYSACHKCSLDFSLPCHTDERGFIVVYGDSENALSENAYAITVAAEMRQSADITASINVRPRTHYG
jgi:hypothetical protein